MGIIRELKAAKQEMMGWRHHLHAHPELSGQEKATADFLVDTLTAIGLPVTRLGSTGVVATLQGKTNISKRAVIFRADTDALPILEDTNVPYISQVPGVMHACGHDGHMAMLLGAAKYLKAHPDFDGTIHFLFQPAEETGTGGQEMIDAGLFQKFPAEAVYGLHNAPAFPLGLLGTRAGDMLSAASDFTITLSGRGGHASNPQKTTDLLSAAAESVLTLKKDFEKNIPNGDKAVLTVTALHTASTAHNVLSDSLQIIGTIRSFDPATPGALKKFLEKTVKSAAAKYGAKAEIAYGTTFPVLTNTRAETDVAMEAARDVLGPLRVVHAPKTLGTEDFASLLKASPGNYMAMGTGDLFCLLHPDKVEGLHSAKYDFNDKSLPVGASYWAKLAVVALKPPKAPKPQKIK